MKTDYALSHLQISLTVMQNEIQNFVRKLA